MWVRRLRGLVLHSFVFLDSEFSAGIGPIFKMYQSKNLMSSQFTESLQNSRELKPKLPVLIQVCLYFQPLISTFSTVSRSYLLNSQWVSVICGALFCKRGKQFCPVSCHLDIFSRYSNLFYNCTAFARPYKNLTEMVILLQVSLTTYFFKFNGAKNLVPKLGNLRML